MTVPSNLTPSSLTVKFAGQKGYLNQSISVEVLEDGKVNANALKQAGRALPDADRYVLYADGEEVAVLTKDKTNWTAHFVEDGEYVKTEIYPRSTTKRPQRKGSKAPAQIDGGPDLTSAVGKAISEMWPSISSAQRGKSVSKALEQTKNQIMNILEDIADRDGISVEEAAKKYNITL